MAVDDSWILFLEKNPQFYELSKGNFYIRFIEMVSKKPTKLSDIKANFFEISSIDMETIMNVLVSLKVVSKKEAGGETIFNLTKTGKKLLSTWKKTHSFYST